VKTGLPDDKYTLMLVTERTRSRWPLPELVRLAVEGGVNAVQVREKDLSESELIDLTGQVVEAAGDKAWVVVNGSLGAARVLGIGVHLPERGPSIQDARSILGADALVGRSVHSVREASASEGVDYVIAGPVHPTKSKPGVEPISIDEFESIAIASSAPVIAIGGITSQNLSMVANAGALGVAVIGTICEAEDPRAAAADIRRTLDQRAEQILGNT
jgi:thiamine-phosphate pyrophosphorylase